MARNFISFSATLFLVAASHATITLLTPEQIAANNGIILPPKPSGGWSPAPSPAPGPAWSAPTLPPGPAWSAPTTTPPPPPPPPTTPGWPAPVETTTGWSVPPVETTTVGWAPPVETTTVGWAPPVETTTVGWAPPVETTTVGWAPPVETTTVGWAPPVETTPGWSVTTEAPETTTVGWAAPPTTPGWPGKLEPVGWQAPIPQGWTTPAPETTTGWPAPPTTPGWSPPSGWAPPASSAVAIDMEGEAAVVGGGVAAATHNSNTTVIGDSTNPATLYINTGSYATLGQSAGVTQISSADPTTGESSTVQIVEGSNLADAGEYYEGQISGNQIYVQNEGSSFVAGEGAVGLAGYTENTSA